MKLDMTVIKNETINKLEKVLKQVHTKFDEMLAIALDAAVLEIDSEKRQEVEIALNDLLNDQMSVFKISFTKTMNKASDLIENSLSS